jgi:hypothetical protein
VFLFRQVNPNGSRSLGAVLASYHRGSPGVDHKLTA